MNIIIILTVQHINNTNNVLVFRQTDLFLASFRKLLLSWSRLK